MRALATLFRVTFPGSLLLVALVFAPFFWGCTWPLGILILNLLTLGASLSWGLGSLAGGPNPCLPRLLMAASLGLMVLGWFVAANAVSNCDLSTDLFTPRARPFSQLPGSVDLGQSVETMVRVTGLLGMTWIAADLARNPSWRLLFSWTIIVTAASVSFLGCLQRWSHAGDIFWDPGRRPNLFFATYRNITSAGEYLNLALPLANAIVLKAFLTRGNPLIRAAAVSAWALISTGSWICGSKLAPAISLIGLAFFIFMALPTLSRWRAHRSRGPGGLMIMIIGGLIATMVLGAGPGTTLDRFHRTFLPGGGATLVHRWQVDKACLLASSDAPILGFGPGTFSLIFPYYSQRVSDQLEGYWSFAHDDLAQALVEWGWVGTGLWACYFGGGVFFLSRHCRPKQSGAGNQIESSSLLVALVLVAVTSLVDFPLQIASIQLEVAILLGMAWSCYPVSPTGPNFPSCGLAGISLRGVAINLIC